MSLIQDKKTGMLYDPQQCFDDIMNSTEYQVQMRRMKDEAWDMKAFIENLKS